ncbi:MAG: DUF2892 domain-containing protein [Alphaproteobacteria bacterium CG_4_10_14_0_2_um_filter_63_37]|nr:MAG: hypothetical protein AUJ55_03870 [Proteobacteria bacterium CG1_02_64_396]PJA24529.1 MAG: DUF2892 domain-containing protein [Alphaproteobacteria bacterium CG_4_10_14_0_2_um_filter_63_37]
MQANMGSVDRGARFVVGLILVTLVFVGPQTPWGWIGLIPLATAVLGWCPLYVPLKLNTKGKEG